MSAEEPVDQFNKIFDFLDIATAKTKETNICRKDSPYPDFKVSTLNTLPNHRNRSTRFLAQHISDVDVLVKKIKKLETEYSDLQQKFIELKESAKEVHKLYEIEKKEHKQLIASTNILQEKCENFESENYKLKHEYEQLEAKLTEKVDVEKYDRLVVRYIKLTQKGDDYNAYSSNFAFLNDLYNYSIEKNLSGVPKRLSPKKRTKKVEKSVQCDLMQSKNNDTKTVGTQVENENGESITKNPTRSQGTQISNTVMAVKETRAQGPQHKVSTTTRGTTTASFIKKHDVGTMFPEKKHTVDKILDEFCDWELPMPLSPIADFKVATETIGTQTNEITMPTTRSIGTCTYVCNVQRLVDYLPPSVTIKNSLSRPPSRLETDDIVKTEMPVSSTTPPTSRRNSESVPQQFSALEQLENGAFAELWKIFGQILLTILNNRNASVPQHTNVPPNTTNPSNQIEFYNWLSSIYERTRVDSHQQHHQATEPIISNNQYSNCSSFCDTAETAPTTSLGLNSIVPEQSHLAYTQHIGNCSYDDNFNHCSSLISEESSDLVSKQLKSNQSRTNVTSISQGTVLDHALMNSLNTSSKSTNISLQKVQKIAEKLLHSTSGSDCELEIISQLNKSTRKKSNKRRKMQKCTRLDCSRAESLSCNSKIEENNEFSSNKLNNKLIQSSCNMSNTTESNAHEKSIIEVEQPLQLPKVLRKREQSETNTNNNKEDCTITNKKIKLNQTTSKPDEEINTEVAKSQCSQTNIEGNSHSFTPISPQIIDTILGKEQHEKDDKQLQYLTKLKGTAMEHSHILDSSTKTIKTNGIPCSPNLETCYDEVNMSLDSDGKSNNTETESGIGDLVSDMSESSKSSSSGANTSTSPTKAERLILVSDDFGDSSMQISSLSENKLENPKHKSFNIFELFGSVSDDDDAMPKENEKTSCKLDSNKTKNDSDTCRASNLLCPILRDDLYLSDSDSEMEETEVTSKSSETRKSITNEMENIINAKEGNASKNHENIHKPTDLMMDVKSTNSNDAINIYNKMPHKTEETKLIQKFTDSCQVEEQTNLVIDEHFAYEPKIKNTTENGNSFIHAETSKDSTIEATALQVDSSIKLIAQNTTPTKNNLTTTITQEMHGVKRKASVPPSTHLTCKRPDLDILAIGKNTSDFVIPIEFGKYTKPTLQPLQILTRSRSKSLQSQVNVSLKQTEGEKVNIGFYNERQIDNEQFDKVTNCDMVSDIKLKLETAFELQKHRKAAFERKFDSKNKDLNEHTVELTGEKSVPPLRSNLNINVGYEATYSPLSPRTNDIKSLETELSIETLIVKDSKKKCEPRKSGLLTRLLGSFDAKQCERVQTTPEVIKENEHASTRLNDSLNYYLTKPNFIKSEKTDFEKLQKSFINITTDWDLIASSVIQYVQHLPRIEQPKKPTFSAIEARLLTICQYFQQQHHRPFILKMLNKVDSTLFHEFGGEKLSLEHALNLTQLYLSLLRTQEPNMLVNPARVFIVKCIYYHTSIASPLIFEVLCVYPTVLPHREQRAYNNSDVLITVIKHHLMCTKYDMDNEELCSKKLLSKLRFEYHFEPFKPTREEVVRNLLDKLNSGKLLHLSYAFAILCKRMSPAKVLDEIVNLELLPLASEYYAQALESEAFDARIATLMEIISMVVNPMPITTNVQTFINIFASFCNTIERPVVQEAAVQSILRLQRFGFANCFNALLNFKPTFELQPQTKAMIRRFVYRKPLYFWKTLQENASVTNN